MLPTGMQSGVWTQLKVGGLFGDRSFAWETQLQIALLIRTSEDSVYH